jgi:uncharacterized protein YpmS
MKKIKLENLIVLIAVLVTTFVLVVDRLKPTPDIKEQIEQNEKKAETVEKKATQEEQKQDVIKSDLKELEELKKKPYGKKDFTHNKSVDSAERYFSRRYGTN